MSYIWRTNIRVLWTFLLTKTWQSCPHRNLFWVREEHNTLFSASPLQGQQPIRKQHTFFFFPLRLFGVPVDSGGAGTGPPGPRLLSARRTQRRVVKSLAHGPKHSRSQLVFGNMACSAQHRWPLTHPHDPLKIIKINPPGKHEMGLEIFKYLEEKSKVCYSDYWKQPYQHVPNVNGGEVPTQCACVCVCLSVRACANAYALHRELFVYRSKLAAAPAVGRLQLYVNDFVTMFI